MSRLFVWCVPQLQNYFVHVMQQFAGSALASGWWCVCLHVGWCVGCCVGWSVGWFAAAATAAAQAPRVTLLVTRRVRVLFFVHRLLAASCNRVLRSGFWPSGPLLWRLSLCLCLTPCGAGTGLLPLLPTCALGIHSFVEQLSTIMRSFPSSQMSTHAECNWPMTESYVMDKHTSMSQNRGRRAKAILLRPMFQLRIL